MLSRLYVNVQESNILRMLFSNSEFNWAIVGFIVSGLSTFHNMDMRSPTRWSLAFVFVVLHRRQGGSTVSAVVSLDTNNLKKLPLHHHCC
jgi:hypothetical protein